MIEVNRDECDFCGACLAVCPENCIELFDKNIQIDSINCTECKFCIYVCPVEAIDYVASKTV